MRFLVSVAVLAMLPMMSACNRGGSDTAKLEKEHGNKRDVTQDWLVGRWAEDDDRDCERSREFQRGGDLMEEGEAREWRLREGRGDDVTLEIDRDEYRAERYGSTLILFDDRDRMTEYRRCSGSAGGASANGSTTGNSAAPIATPPAPSTVDPAVTAEIEQGVAEMRGQLPLRQGPLTITNVTSSGAQLTLVGTVSVDIIPAQWTEIETRLRQGNCSGSEGALIRRGASVTTQISDSTGETRSFTTASCPAS